MRLPRPAASLGAARHLAGRAQQFPGAAQTLHTGQTPRRYHAHHLIHQYRRIRYDTDHRQIMAQPARDESFNYSPARGRTVRAPPHKLSDLYGDSHQPIVTSEGTGRSLFAFVIKGLAGFFDAGVGGVVRLAGVAGRRVGLGLGVACPKSWCPGCEPVALESESFPGCPPEPAFELGLLPAKPDRPGATARPRSRRRHQSGHPPSPARHMPGRSWPRSPHPAGSRRVFRPSVRRCARRKPWLPRRGPGPSGARPREDHLHLRLSAHRHRLDHHRHAS